jgi:hypothetical protein
LSDIRPEVAFFTGQERNHWGRILVLRSKKLVKPAPINPPAPSMDAIKVAFVLDAVFLGEDAAP